MNIAENNLVRFISITKKKDGLFANFRVKGMKGGATFSSSISVDINQANVQANDPLEKIIDECGAIAARMSETKLQFEGLVRV
jgi:hypothetical protein